MATDALGSTIALVGSGYVQTSYGYDPYGFAQLTGNATTNPFQFTGRESDGTGLMHYRNRYYNPAWGRFVSEDPIGLADGINVYAYANNNPTTYSDPTGLFTGGGHGGLGNYTPPTVPSVLPAEKCQGVCCSGGTHGTTPMYIIGGKIMFRDCAVKELGIGDLSGTEQACILGPFLR